jgi:16S rRNA C967 or C1407 C5-methylase (RsmB/RsmF family)
MEYPSKLVLKLAQRLFTDDTEQEQFITALTNPQPYAPCILWCSDRPKDNPFSLEIPLDWQPSFIDRLTFNAQPGKHLLHQSGDFYCLDFSSIFAASILLNISIPVGLIIDVCAAPGGKSIFAWRGLKPELLMANEAIAKRLAMLVSNLKRCQVFPNLVTNLDPSILAIKCCQTSDLVIVDAPCSGQSLLAKKETNLGCFHPNLVNKNANRQKRIIINSAQLVAPQGYLAYMTCTYSPEENEEVCGWFLRKAPQFKSVKVNFLEDYQSRLTDIFCYRMFPQQKLGAGAFTALFQNTETGNKQEITPELASKIYRGITS